MKVLFISLLLCHFSAIGQLKSKNYTALDQGTSEMMYTHLPLQQPKPNELPKRWKLDRNKIVTGSLLLTAGLAKGFNEGLQYRYNGFEEIFPYANDQWFYPTFSFKNKYKDGDPEKGARFPLSTSVLVMFTDQYHLNNFIQKTALTAALIIKIGEGKKPFKHYLLDILYYTVCYQAGFHAIYQPISMRN